MPKDAAICPRPWKDLNQGRWIFLDLPSGTTPQQLIDLIEARTGVLIDQNAVSFKTHSKSSWRFVIAVSDEAIAALLEWGLSGDELNMSRLCFRFGKDW
jgi:hypothetical protein